MLKSSKKVLNNYNSSKCHYYLGKAYLKVILTASSTFTVINPGFCSVMRLQNAFRFYFSVYQSLCVNQSASLFSLVRFHLIFRLQFLLGFWALVQ